VELALTLWLLKHSGESGLDPANPPTLPRPGLTSLLVDKALPPAFYRVAGFHPCGVRAVRIDMLERLADLIRPLVAWRPDPANANPAPKGATGDGGFRVTPEMMSILGCSSSNVGEVLQELGFRMERVAVRPEPAPAIAEAAARPAVAEAAAAAPADAAAEPAAPEIAPVPAEVVVMAVAVDSTNGAATAAAAESSPPGTATIMAAASITAAADTSTADVAPALESPAAESKPATDANGTAEPKLEEIWRPRRQGRHHERERGRRRGGPAPAAAVAGKEPREGKDAPTETAHQRRGQETRDGRPKRHDRHGHDRRERQNRPADRHGDRGDRHADRQGRPDRGDRKERRHGPGRRDDRRDDRQPRLFRSAPAPKPGIDPDSPFAALSSLKAALEKQSQE
jgi:ATP-dependent RNA helicase SUPV3L1/SUV3